MRVKGRGANHGETPCTRLCLCEHNFANHWQGFCGVCRRLGLVCEAFEEDKRIPRLVYGLPYLVSAEVFDPHRHYARRPA